MWETDTFYERSCSLSTYRNCFQAAALGWKHQNSKWNWKIFTELRNKLSLSRSKTIKILIQIINRNISLSNQVNQVVINMMQMDFSINPMAFKITCILVLHHCALFCILSFPCCVLYNMLILWFWFQGTSMKLFTYHLLHAWDT